jgi:hypothetical protein
VVNFTKAKQRFFRKGASGVLFQDLMEHLDGAVISALNPFFISVLEEWVHLF